MGLHVCYECHRQKNYFALCFTSSPILYINRRFVSETIAVLPPYTKNLSLTPQSFYPRRNINPFVPRQPTVHRSQRHKSVFLYSVFFMSKNLIIKCRPYIRNLPEALSSVVAEKIPLPLRTRITNPSLFLLMVVATTERWNI